MANDPPHPPPVESHVRQAGGPVAQLSAIRRLRDQIFGPELEMLRQSLQRFVEREISPSVDEWERLNFFPNDVFSKLGANGFLGLGYPEEVGGSGGGYAARVVLAEELSRCGSGAIPMAVAVQTDMATPAIWLFGSARQQERYLRPALNGTKIAAIAITEPGAGSDVAGIRTTATKVVGGYRVSGRKAYITNGSRCDFCTLVATVAPGSGHKGIVLLLVDTDSDGFSVERLYASKVGMAASDTAQLLLDDVFVPEENLIGGVERRGFHQLMQQLQYERLINAVLSITQADELLGATVRYVRERKVFGHLLARHQVVAHMLADLVTDLAGATAFVLSTIASVTAGEVVDTDISLAKKQAAQVQCRVADSCLQLYGGAGYVGEFGVGRQWRDSRVQRIGGGSDEIMNEIIARRLGLG